MNLVYEGTEESLRAIKFSLLYFDTFDVLFPQTVLNGHILPLYSEIGKSELEMLINANIVRSREVKFNAFIDDNTSIDKEIEQALNNIDKLPQEIKSALTDPKINLVLGNLVSDKHLDALRVYTMFEKFETKEAFFQRITAVLAGLYYYGQIYSLITSDLENSASIVSNIGTNYLHNQLLTNNMNVVDRGITYYPNALELFLPEYNELSFEGILELRTIARDELEELRNYITDVSRLFQPSAGEGMDEFLSNRIKPAINNFMRKVANSRISTLQSILTELKNPTVFVPMITTVCTDIPALHATIASLGLSTINVALSGIKNANEIKQDQLSFLLKLNSKKSSIL